jgi:hypothetical protein
MASLSTERPAVKRWTVAAIVVAILMYAAACSDEVYDLTSPPGFEWHILLRKAYSVVAFALVGYLLRRALIENGRLRIALTCIAAIAAYSALIEVGQFVLGSKEGLAWNAVDTACGALGGAIAVGDRLFPALRLRR